ncbi:hypothetical protein KUCAC02_005739, partial [Chaenocephalus aceratus]
TLSDRLLSSPPPLLLIIVRIPASPCVLGFSGISGAGEGLGGVSELRAELSAFPVGTSRIDLECERFGICVWAELIESPKNLAALTPGR